MSYIPYQFPLTGGLDRSVVPCRADPATFYTLANMRQSNSARGSIEQTPRFYVERTINQGTYYTGSTVVTETTTSAVRYHSVQSIFGTNKQALTLTNFCAFYFSGVSNEQLKVFIQTAFPAGLDNLNKGCLLTVVDSTALTSAVGGSYDVVIDGAGTFKWRIDGGAYTTGVVISKANGNLIDGGAIKLYWLADTGFTVADTWTWRRTDAITSDNSAQSAPLEIQYIGTQGFFVATNGGATNGRLFVIETPTTGNPYVRTVGYQSVYGASVGVYDKHLLVFGTNVLRTGSSGSYLLSSDLTNYDVFFLTDVNEADIFSIELVIKAASSGLLVLNGFVIQNRLYVVTNVGICYSDYAGLPIPFSFKWLLSESFDTSRCYCLTRNGAYVWSHYILYFFNGVALAVICDMYNTLGVYTPQIGVWRTRTEELVLLTSQTWVFLVYQARYNTFYTVSCDFSASGATALAVNVNNDIYVGSISRKVLREDTGFSQTPVFDYNAGVSYAVPTVTTQLIGGNAAKVKEIGPIYIAPTVTTGSSVKYSVAAFTKITLSWYISNDGKISGSPATDSAATWTTASPTGQITPPRTAYRFIAFQLTLSGTDGSLPPGATTLQAIETMIYSSLETHR